MAKNAPIYFKCLDEISEIPIVLGLGYFEFGVVSKSKENGFLSLGYAWINFLLNDLFVNDESLSLPCRERLLALCCLFNNSILKIFFTFRNA